MIMNNYLSQISDTFLMTLGSQALQDVDTPSFMRKEYDVKLMDTIKSQFTGLVVEPDQKIVNFLSVIRRKDFLPQSG